MSGKVRKLLLEYIYLLKMDSFLMMCDNHLNSM